MFSNDNHEKWFVENDKLHTIVFDLSFTITTAFIQNGLNVNLVRSIVKAIHLN